MTHHALRFAAPILALVIAMILAPLGAGLMLRIRELPGERASFSAAPLATIPAASRAAPTGNEVCAAPSAPGLEQDNDRHVARRDQAEKLAMGVQA